MQMTIFTRIKLFTAFIGTCLSSLLGGWDMALKILVTFVVLDYVTGVLAASYKKKTSSAIGYKGIIRKIGIFVIVIVACQIDKILGVSPAIRLLAIYFYVGNEGISIAENWGRMGLPLPPKLKEALQQLKDKGSEGIKGQE